MATGVLVGVLGRSRRSWERETEGEMRTRESARGVPGGGVELRETSRERRRQPGREEVAGVWPRAPGTRPCLLARGGRRQGGEAAVGWAVLGWLVAPGKWLEELGRVGFSLSFF